MGRLEVIVGLLLGAVLFLFLKLIGMVVKFAAIAAVMGFVTGFLLARSWRR